MNGWAHTTSMFDQNAISAATFPFSFKWSTFLASAGKQYTSWHCHIHWHDHDMIVKLHMLFTMWHHNNMFTIFRCDITTQFWMRSRSVSHRGRAAVAPIQCSPRSPCSWTSIRTSFCFFSFGFITGAAVLLFWLLQHEWSAAVPVYKSHSVQHRTWTTSTNSERCIGYVPVFRRNGLRRKRIYISYVDAFTTDESSFDRTDDIILGSVGWTTFRAATGTFGCGPAWPVCRDDRCSSCFWFFLDYRHSQCCQSAGDAPWMPPHPSNGMDRVLWSALWWISPSPPWNESAECRSPGNQSLAWPCHRSFGSQRSVASQWTWPSSSNWRHRRAPGSHEWRHLKIEIQVIADFEHFFNSHIKLLGNACLKTDNAFLCLGGVVVCGICDWVSKILMHEWLSFSFWCMNHVIYHITHIVVSKLID